MELFHATTQIRGEQILKDRCIKKCVERYYSNENGSNGLTTQGYVYLTNEITFSIYFANCHNLSEANENIYIFKIEVPDDLLQPDEDEIELQSPNNESVYPNRLAWSLGELKSCRIAENIDIQNYSTYLFCIKDISLDEILELVKHAGYPYDYVVAHYTDDQQKFLDSIVWTKL